MFIDYHTHHERCGHAIGKLREYVEQAISIGLSQIGLSDHMPVIHLPKEKILPGLGMEVAELENYVREALDLKREYIGDIDVKVGLEADYIEGYELEIEKLLASYPFDYVIGSVHFLGEWDFSDSRQMYGWREKSINEIFESYYLTVQKAAKSKLYDIVGHFDVIKKFGHVPTKDISPFITAALRSIKESDMVVELNASGLFRVGSETYPKKEIIKHAYELGIPFTLGSDAHRPEDVHVGVEKGREILKELGVEKLATFENRRKIMVPLI